MKGRCDIHQRFAPYRNNKCDECETMCGECNVRLPLADMMLCDDCDEYLCLGCKGWRR